jgi:hypothetical protein
MMTRNLHPQHTILSILFIFIALSGMLGACLPFSETPKSTGGVDIELTLTVEEPAAQELTLVSPTEVDLDSRAIANSHNPSDRNTKANRSRKISN